MTHTHKHADMHSHTRMWIVAPVLIMKAKHSRITSLMLLLYLGMYQWAYRRVWHSINTGPIKTGSTKLQTQGVNWWSGAEGLKVIPRPSWVCLEYLTRKYWDSPPGERNTQVYWRDSHLLQYHTGTRSSDILINVHVFHQTNVLPHHRRLTYNLICHFFEPSS